MSSRSYRSISTQRCDELIADGANEDEARTIALTELRGPITLAHHIPPQQSFVTTPPLRSPLGGLLFQHTGYAVRQLVRHPVFSIVAAGAALFASAGPVQFWSGSVSAGDASRERFQSAFDRMRMLQNAPDDFMYQGLPARRYKTFWLESTPIEDVRDSDVPLFVAQGTRDGTVMASDLFAMEAVRQQPKRSLRYVVVDGGDHAFEMPDGTSRVATLFDEFLNWVLDPKRQTGIGVLR